MLGLSRFYENITTRPTEMLVKLWKPREDVDMVVANKKGGATAVGEFHTHFCILFYFKGGLFNTP